MEGGKNEITRKSSFKETINRIDNMPILSDEGAWAATLGGHPKVRGLLQPSPDKTQQHLWVDSNLRLQNHWHKSVQPHVRQTGLGRRKGYGGGLLCQSCPSLSLICPPPHPFTALPVFIPSFPHSSTGLQSSSLL